jgi:hypothetical protein
MLRDDNNQPFWKEKFINGLPHLFALKIKQVLVNKNNVIEYDNLTYGNIISAIQNEGLMMCIDMKISNQVNKDKKAKYEMGNFCEQYGLPSVAPSKKHKKSRKHEESKRGGSRVYLEIRSSNGGVDREMVSICEHSNKHANFKFKIRV